jgi:hypothetical protein
MHLRPCEAGRREASLSVGPSRPWLQYPQLTAESRKTRAGHLRDPAVSWIGDDFQQLFDTPAPDGGNNLASLHVRPQMFRRRQCRR